MKKKKNTVSPKRVEQIIRFAMALKVAMNRNGGYLRSAQIGKMTKAHRIGNGIESYMVEFGVMQRKNGKYSIEGEWDRKGFEDFAQYLFVKMQKYHLDRKNKQKAMNKQLKCRFDAIQYQLNSDQIAKVADAIINNEPTCTITIDDIANYLTQQP
jgi:hypothetical protein